MRQKPFVIGEIGINHNGDIEIAKNLIIAAKKAGFDAVKFQKRDIEIVYTKEQLDTPRESPWGTTTRQQKEGLEFGKKEYDEIDELCKKIGIEWFASAWDVLSLEFLNKYKLKHNKIASAMIVDLDLLKKTAQQKKYTFISTGMTKLADIENAVKTFRDEKCEFELMHCVSTYPMKIEDANLETINELKEIFKCKVGYSGHETGLAVSYAACGYDISSLERHITLGREMYGSDQSASLETRGMNELISVINIMFKASGTKSAGKITDEELIVAKKLRAHIKL